MSKQYQNQKKKRIEMNKEILFQKLNKRIRILANAISEQQRHGQINPFLMRDVEHIILDESLMDKKIEKIANNEVENEIQ